MSATEAMTKLITPISGLLSMLSVIRDAAQIIGRSTSSTADPELVHLELAHDLDEIISRIQGGKCPFFADRLLWSSDALQAPICEYVHEECNEWGPPFGQVQKENLCA